LLATGGCRTEALAELAVFFGHRLASPVPSLFTFHIAIPWVRELAGSSVLEVEVSVAGTRLSARRPLLFTHWGLSGPAILRLSAWGARTLHGKGYNFSLLINWLPDRNSEKLRAELAAHGKAHAGKMMANAAFPSVPSRIWQALMSVASIPRERRWS